MTKEEFAEKLKEFCLSHGFEIAGTCWSESIYGEITIQAVGETTVGWREWDEHKFNFETKIPE